MASPPPVDSTTRSKVLRVIVISLLLDLISFTFILPLFPKLIEFYLERDVSSSSHPTLLRTVLSYLNRYKAAFARPIDNHYDVVLLGGAMGSLFSSDTPLSFVPCLTVEWGKDTTSKPSKAWRKRQRLCEMTLPAILTILRSRILQALASPIIGKLSDRYGRRKALLASMIGNSLSVLLWVVAVDFRTFLASRIVGGLSEGNVQLALAMATDISDERNRGATMALIGACFSVAFTIGPALGAWLSNISTFAANPFATAAGFSFVLIVVETIYLYFALPETLPTLANKGPEAVVTVRPTKGNAAPASTSTSAPDQAQRGTNSPTLLNAIHFSFLLLFSGMESSLSFMTYELFAFPSSRNGRLLGFIGLVASVLQGGVTRRLAPISSVRIGVGACLVAFLLLARLSTVGTLYAAATCLAITSATVVTGLNALASFEAAHTDRGAHLGVMRSWGQLGRAIGPLLFTSIYWWAGRETAYGAGAVGIAAVLTVVALGLKAPPAIRIPAIKVVEKEL